MTSNDKNSTKSLFLYTALIFVVALLLILIAFFGDSNLERNITHIEPTQTPAQTAFPNKISERAAELSEENMLLLGENKTLKEENATLKAELDVYKKLFSAKEQKDAQNTEEVTRILGEIDYESLDKGQQEMYNYIQG